MHMCRFLTYNLFSRVGLNVYLYYSVLVIGNYRTLRVNGCERMEVVCSSNFPKENKVFIMQLNYGNL